MTIYLIRNKVNGKCYVGQTERSLAQRWSEHLHATNRFKNYPLYRAMKKYGVENFEVLQFCTTGTQESADQLETVLIASAHAKAPHGYNQTDGGKRGARGHKMSEAAKAKLRAYRLGRKASPETRAKIGDVQRGEKNHNFGKLHSTEQKEK